MLGYGADCWFGEFVKHAQIGDPFTPIGVHYGQVQKQTLDVAALIRTVAPMGQYYMTMEDDLELCQHGMHAIQYMIDKARRHHSYGSFHVLLVDESTFCSS